MKERGSRRFRIITRGSIKRLAILFVLIFTALLLSYCTMIHMPGKSYRGPLPPLTEDQSALSAELQRDVDMLARVIGRRSVFYPKGLDQAEAFLTRALADAGYAVQRQEFNAHGRVCANLEVEIQGSTHPEEIVVIGAHYDSVDNSPAANDNGSGVAATLALARRFAHGRKPERTVRFVLFVNEEPPWFQTDLMGSLVYARRCQERRENVAGMISLETIGYYSDRPGSQSYPLKFIDWLYPDTGNFIGFVGNTGSRQLVRQAIGSFRKNAQFPSEGAALPGWITGVGWSDHWSFWQCGYPALMVTDTAPFRYPHYHGLGDTPEKLDYDRMARVVEAMERVMHELASLH